MPRLSRMERYADLRARLENVEESVTLNNTELVKNEEELTTEVKELVETLTNEESITEENKDDNDFFVAEEEEKEDISSYEADINEVSEEKVVEDEEMFELPQEETINESFETFISEESPVEISEETTQSFEKEDIFEESDTASEAMLDISHLLDSLHFLEDAHKEEAEVIEQEKAPQVVLEEAEIQPAEELFTEADESVISQPEETELPFIEEVTPHSIEEKEEMDTVVETVIDEDADLTDAEIIESQTIEAAEEVAVEAIEEEEVDDLLTQTLQEVNEYNKAKGLVTADEITPTILEEIRGDSMEETAAEEERTISAEQQDINDTVTMEIESILRAIEEEKQKEEAAEEMTDSDKDYIQHWMSQSTNTDKEITNLMGGAPVESLQIEDKTALADQEIKEMEVTKSFEPLEHPVLTKELVSEEEITFAEETLLNDTKTYVIEKEIREEAANEEVEEESSSKLLNIILTVLVIALVAILAVTAFGLLRTMNIL